MILTQFFRPRSMGFVLLGLLALILGACSNVSSEPAAISTPKSAPPNVIITPSEAAATPAMSQTIKPPPEGLALLKQLVLDKPIVVGIANDSAQTVSITIPTMF